MLKMAWILASIINAFQIWIFRAGFWLYKTKIQKSNLVLVFFLVYTSTNFFKIQGLNFQKSGKLPYSFEKYWIYLE